VKHAIYRAIIEIAFILFLFYANLLMGKFERSGRGQTMGLAWVVRDELDGNKGLGDVLTKQFVDSSDVCYNPAEVAVEWTSPRAERSVMWSVDLPGLRF